MQVAVLGTGIMGTGIARSLLREGLRVRVWNRSAEKASSLADDGAGVAATSLEAVTGADVVITMLYDADSVLSVMADAAGGSGPGTVWMQSSTIGLPGMRKITEFAGEHDLLLLDTPVLGTKKPADDGKLVILVSGDESLRKQVEPVLSAIGSRTMWIGERLGDATALKLACNAWVASLTAALGQSLALAAALGVKPELFLEAIAGGPIDTPYAHVKGAAMMTGEFAPSFALDGVLKDLKLIRGAAEDAGVHDGLLAALVQTYARARDDGHGADDMAAVHTAFQPERVPGP